MTINALTVRFNLMEHRWEVLSPTGRVVATAKHFGVAVAWMEQHPDYMPRRARVAQNRATAISQRATGHRNYHLKPTKTTA